MHRVNEVIVVEGRYDKNTLRQIVDAVILETSGFGIFNDAEKRRLLRRLAEERGLIILTDPDGAGFLIRGHISSFIDPRYVKHAYIPDIQGKERRKSAPSKEGKLGVEGMRPDILLEALRRAGATIDDVSAGERLQRISKADLFAAGLSGGIGSGEKRRELLRNLQLPERMSANAMLEVLNALMDRDQFLRLTKETDREAVSGFAGAGSTALLTVNSESKKLY